MDCSFTGNAAQDGGGVYIGGGPVQLTNDTVWANSAGNYTGAPRGGGVDVFSGANATLDNTIVAGNTSDLLDFYGEDIGGTVVSTSREQSHRRR